MWAAALGRVELTFVSDIVRAGAPAMPPPLPRPIPTFTSPLLAGLSCGCKDRILFKALLTDLLMEVRKEPNRPKPGCEVTFTIVTSPMLEEAGVEIEGSKFILESCMYVSGGGSTGLGTITVGVGGGMYFFICGKLGSIARLFIRPSSTSERSLAG